MSMNRHQITIMCSISTLKTLIHAIDASAQQLAFPFTPKEVISRAFVRQKLSTLLATLQDREKSL